METFSFRNSLHFQLMDDKTGHDIKMIKYFIISKNILIIIIFLMSNSQTGDLSRMYHTQDKQ